MDSFTQEMRQETCIHEAAHAVINALGGISVYHLAVVAEGSTKWSCEDRDGNLLQNVYGVCGISDLEGLYYLKWDEFNGCYFPVQNWLQGMSKKFRPHFRQRLRAGICGLLAGPAASQIWRGEEVNLWDRGYAPMHDIDKALGLAYFLYWRDEYNYLAKLTEQTLRCPEVWTCILQLADELDQRGQIEECMHLLPDAIPNWPLSPMTKKPFNLEGTAISLKKWSIGEA